MILPQKVKVKWHGMSRGHYEALGYKYTKKDKEFYVNAHELSPGSNAIIKFKCDYCGEEESKRNDTLMRQRKTINKDSCKDCAPKKHNESLLVKYGTLESKYPKIAREWCESNNKVPASDITPYSGKKGNWICEQGHKWTATVYSRTGMDTGCPICSESKGERRLAKTLDELSVKYKREVCLNDLIGIGGGFLRFDFALVSEEGMIKALIEYDGPFHFGSLFEGDRHEITAKHDKMKNDYCVRNNIPLYRIPYFEYERVPEIVEKICREVLSVECGAITCR